MFIAFAIMYGKPREAATRWDRFTGGSFAYEIAADGTNGTVTLQPEGHVLRVGLRDDEYESVRLFDESGLLLGTLRRSTAGAVEWVEPVIA